MMPPPLAGTIFFVAISSSSSRDGPRRL
jgi:hypothetical protein